MHDLWGSITSGSIKNSSPMTVHLNQTLRELAATGGSIETCHPPLLTQAICAATDAAFPELEGEAAAAAAATESEAALQTLWAVTKASSRNDAPAVRQYIGELSQRPVFSVHFAVRTSKSGPAILSSRCDCRRDAHHAAPALPGTN